MEDSVKENYLVGFIQNVIKECEEDVKRRCIDGLSYKINSVVEKEVASLLRNELIVLIKPILKELIEENVLPMGEEKVSLREYIRNWLGVPRNAWSKRPRLSEIIESYLQNYAEKIVSELTKNELKDLYTRFKDSISSIMFEKCSSQL
jgi:hypothetical protein